MFDFVFKGSAPHGERFASLLERHARWLGLRSETAGETLADGRRLQRHRLAVPASAPAPCADARVRFDLDATNGAVEIEVPFVTSEPLFWHDGEAGFVAGNDLRPLWIWSGGVPDATGMAALMQYGMVAPPLSPARGVGRLPCGYRLRHADGVETAPVAEPLLAGKVAVPDDEVERLTLERLDAALAGVPPESVVFFSGGIDSSLLAARLAARGRRDARLVNYAFAADDPESAHAERVARELGLPFRRVVHDAARVPATFDRIGRDASFPYNDLSTIPTHLMIEGAAEWLAPGGAALVGVGADDLYDGGMKIGAWNRVRSLPRALRRATVALLGATRPWRRDGRSRRIWGVLRRSLASRRPYGAAIMHNDLARIAYRYPAGVQERVEQAWAASYDHFCAGCPDEDLLAFVYLVNGGLGWEAPKFEPLRRLGVESRYPFLDAGMLRHAFSLDWRQKCAGTKHKVLLETLLDRSLPSGLERRAKVGFSPPYARMLADPQVQERMRAALLDRSSPLAGVWHDGFVRGALDRGARGEAPNRGVINVLWTAFFAASWTAQVTAALSD